MHLEGIEPNKNLRGEHRENADFEVIVWLENEGVEGQGENNNNNNGYESKANYQTREGKKARGKSRHGEAIARH